MRDRQARLAASRLYLCTDARERQGDLPGFLDSALAGGVDVVQLRQKGLEARQELAYLEVFADACARHGALLAVNDRADLALAAGADILHLGQDDLPVAIARTILGQEVLIGRSTHSLQQAQSAATEADASYFCTGPCWPTPTKPGRSAPGLGLVSWAAEQSFTRPWFAIGGINLARLDEVIAAGAERVVVVRAITDADDPGAAAAAIKSRLTRRPAGPLEHVPL
ncbi:MAG: thiamine-phosphate pyrophosphorylase [Cryptosporangiaceae bacterium]|jgi:thiamine-phosphate pyrophosphorylase|nr:thiamine-phosphate pyrophosphorylase [Cryptosporangiaceae bacterium]